MKKKTELECGGCDSKCTVSWTPEEDSKWANPIMCPFCGEEVLIAEDPDDGDDDDDDDHDTEFGW